VALCDLHMEAGDRLLFIELVRRDRNSPNRYLAVIMVGGYSDVARVVEARDAGANAFLTKPVSAKSIYLRLTGEIDTRRQFVNGKCYVGPCRRRKNLCPPNGMAERRADEGAEYI
jgi:two-component system chemotaxis response regulator CheY